MLVEVVRSRALGRLSWMLMLASVAELVVPRQVLAEPATAPAESSAEMVRVDVQDVFLDERDSTHVVVLRSRGAAGTILPIWIGEMEALAIALRVNRQRAPRPLTHDLMEKMLVDLDAKVEKVFVEAIRGKVFLGRVFLRTGGRSLEFDARPSDSIALAVGSQAPIFVSSRLLREAGLPATSEGKREEPGVAPKAPAGKAHGLPSKSTESGPVLLGPKEGTRL